MANLKSITELPVATSADGVNLIVNDNGYAKQIAAGAVGAQADWNVKDEANPAFVKNKPFYDTREYSEFNLTFDGDLTGKEYVDIGNNMYFVKISNQPISKEEISGATIYLFFEGQVQTIQVNPDMLMVDESGNIHSNVFPAIIMQNSGEFDGRSLTAGVWVICTIVDGSLVGYVSKISKTTLIGGELQKIEPKYIPEPEYDFDIEIHTSWDERTQEESMDLVVNSANFESTYEKLTSNIMPKAKVMGLSVFIDENGIEDSVKTIYISTEVIVLWDSATNSISESEPIVFRFYHDGWTEHIGINPDNSVFLN